MNATVTDDLELVLRWWDGGESTVHFALASSSEFTISCRICWKPDLNYQGEARVAFQTMCYGHDLDQFASGLRSLSEGSSGVARFHNTGGDFEIHIAPHERMGQQILLSQLFYRHYRLLSDVSCDSELILPVGVTEDVQGTARAIREILRLLKVDCTY
jgi:hypothetical protein